MDNFKISSSSSDYATASMHSKFWREFTVERQFPATNICGLKNTNNTSTFVKTVTLSWTAFEQTAERMDWIYTTGADKIRNFISSITPISWARRGDGISCRALSVKAWYGFTFELAENQAEKQFDEVFPPPKTNLEFLVLTHARRVCCSPAKRRKWWNSRKTDWQSWLASEFELFVNVRPSRDRKWTASAGERKRLKTAWRNCMLRNVSAWKQTGEKCN